MLSIANVSSAQASSYYKKDDYYVRDESGQWQGKLKEAMSLPDQIEKEDFDKIIKRHEKRAGFDLCFSAPKSVSMAAFLNDELRDIIEKSHNEAVAETLERIEENEIYTRVTKDGQTEMVKTGNMICGKFNHYVSRNQDMQIHTHCVILNETVYNDKVYSISNESLYQNKMLYGQSYRNSLAKKLQEAGLEITVTDREKGFFELAEIKREDIEVFSTRRSEIEEQLKEWGTDSSQAASKAAEKTRVAKENKDLNQLKESWKISLDELGVNVSINKEKEFEPNEMDEIFKKIESQISKKTFAFEKNEFYKEALRKSLGIGATIEDIERYTESRINEKGMYILGEYEGKEYFCTKESYDIENFIFKSVENGKGKARNIDLETVKNHTENTTLFDEQKKAVEHICSSKDRYIAIQGMAGTGKTFMLNHAREVLEENGYTVRGMSFTGKAADELEKKANIDSRTVHSFLNQLEKEAGNFDKDEIFEGKDTWALKGLEREEKEVWIVDEASMINNQLMKNLCNAADHRGAKVVLVGDNKQLQAIGAGSAFDNLIRHDHLEYVTMSDIRRQKEENLKEAVIEAVRGDVDKSLDILSSKTIEIKDRHDRLQKIANDYSFQDQKDRGNSIILTGSNADRHLINDLVRKNLKDIGELEEGKIFRVKAQKDSMVEGDFAINDKVMFSPKKIEADVKKRQTGHIVNINEDILTIDSKGKEIKINVNDYDIETQKENIVEREFSVNDKIMFLRNDKELDVKNGRTGYIKTIDGNILTINSAGRDIEVNMDEYNYLDHGYAMTAHKAQGMTAEKAFIHINTYQKRINSRNGYYVDISRAEYEVQIYTNDKKELNKAVSKFDVKLSSQDFKFNPNQEIKKKGIEWDDIKTKNKEITIEWNDVKSKHTPTPQPTMKKGMQI